MPNDADTQLPVLRPIDAALDYTARGIAVLPVHWPIPVTPHDHSREDEDTAKPPILVCSCAHGAACPLPARHLITGTITDATTDARRIIEWWTSMPTANLATPAGLTFDVLDYTYPGPTAPLLAWLTASGLDPTPILTTGDGHLHFPVRNPNPSTPHADHGGRLPHLHRLDYGTPVLLPPSQLTTNHQITWLHPFTDSIALLPDADRLFTLLANLPDPNQLDR